MGHVGSLALRAVDDEKLRRRERAESARTLAVARSVNQHAEDVARKVRRMTDLYRERLDGVRDKP